MADAKTLGSAIAGGVIAASLMQTLRQKDILSLDECRAILETALRALGPIMRSPEEAEAGKIIGAMLRDQFPATGR